MARICVWSWDGLLTRLTRAGRFLASASPPALPLAYIDRTDGESMSVGGSGSLASTDATCPVSQLSHKEWATIRVTETSYPISKPSHSDSVVIKKIDIPASPPDANGVESFSSKPGHVHTTMTKEDSDVKHGRLHTSYQATARLYVSGRSGWMMMAEMTVGACNGGSRLAGIKGRGGWWCWWL